MTKKKKPAKRAVDVITIAPGGPTPPTPEQASRAPYITAGVHDISPQGRERRIGTAYQRQPRFETIEGLSLLQIRALRRYRRVYDTSELSPVKSGLDIGTGGRTGGTWAAISRVERVAFADVALREMEACVRPHLVRTLRAVAALDMDFSAVAIERFGGRIVDKIDTSGRRSNCGSALAPRSGKHRTIVREEFFAAATALADRLYPTPMTPPAAELAGESPTPAATVPAEFLDDAGRMLPLDRVADIIRDRFAGEEHGEKGADKE